MRIISPSFRPTNHSTSYKAQLNQVHIRSVHPQEIFEPGNENWKKHSSAFGWFRGRSKNTGRREEGSPYWGAEHCSIVSKFGFSTLSPVPPSLSTSTRQEFSPRSTTHNLPFYLITELLLSSIRGFQPSLFIQAASPAEVRCLRIGVAYITQWILATYRRRSRRS